ncbi:hypothetical protein V7S43_014222 [Phytophthora oleae]|uniref:Transposase IS891/IS1136/IS1341 domain-containing protein n=1 Tax=Phytophthora oleae TaxID=2107226 RepID=A0ABD3F5T7_9STRA
MFAANRAVYNNLVEMSKEDRATRLATRDKKVKMTLNQLGEKYRPIAKLKTMNKYFRNKRGLARHREVPDEVRDSAYRDFTKAVKASIAGFFAKLNRDEKASFPAMRFKSKYAPSNTIELAARSFTVVQEHRLRFKPTYFGFETLEGIEVREQLPELTMSIRLQRLREGEYFIIVPQKKAFTRSETTRVCAIDPGVRNFVTVYDPEGRAFSVNDSGSTVKKKFKAVDAMKSTLAGLDNESKAKHPDKVPTKRKRGGRKSKTKQHRQRYRLRRRIRLTSRKVTRIVNDLHQKLASWLSAHYYNMLYRRSRPQRWCKGTSWM